MGQPACLAARVSLVFSFISNLNEVNEKAGLSKTRFLASLLASFLACKSPYKCAMQGMLIYKMPAPASLYSTSTLHLAGEQGAFPAKYSAEFQQERERHVSRLESHLCSASFLIYIKSKKKWALPKHACWLPCLLARLQIT